jgi:THO complex subunit 4
MSALDQSLDEIISSKPKKQFRKKANLGNKAKVGKAVAKPAGKPTKKAAAPIKAAAQNNVLDVSYATKVVVYHLPKDIKTDAIKVCSSIEWENSIL